MPTKKTVTKKTTTARTKKAYTCKGITTSIQATSRCAVKVKDNYYTIEACEERKFENVEGMVLELEWKALFESVNNIVDAQVEEIYDTVK